MKKVDFTLNEITKNPQRFFVGIATWLSKPDVAITLRGDTEKVKIVQEALRATMEFQKELNKSASTLTSVSEKLAAKHAAADSFKQAVNLQWPF